MDSALPALRTKKERKRNSKKPLPADQQFHVWQRRCRPAPTRHFSTVEAEGEGKWFNCRGSFIGTRPSGRTCWVFVLDSPVARWQRGSHRWVQSLRAPPMDTGSGAREMASRVLIDVAFHSQNSMTRWNKDGSDVLFINEFARAGAPIRHESHWRNSHGSNTRISIGCRHSSPPPSPPFPFPWNRMQICKLATDKNNKSISWLHFNSSGRIRPPHSIAEATIAIFKWRRVALLLPPSPTHSPPSSPPSKHTHTHTHSHTHTEYWINVIAIKRRWVMFHHCAGCYANDMQMRMEMKLE